MYNLMDVDHPSFAVIYSLVNIIIGTFFIMNLILAVIIDTFVNIQERERKRAEGQQVVEIILNDDEFHTEDYPESARRRRMN
jgi:regulatory protein YycI of two-component signal transduction system YycFG